MRSLICKIILKIRLLRYRLAQLLCDECYFIGTGEALPAPLSPEEEAYFLSLLNTQNRELGKKPLIEHNLRLVVYVARKFENTGIALEDLVSIGSIGLIKAINTFNVDKNIKLATYASRCIENEILMFLRKIHNQRTEISLNEPLNTDWDGNELLLSDILGTDSDEVYKNIEDAVDKELLMTSVEKLSNREQEILRLRFGLSGTDEKTQKEVADMLGISQSYISRLEKRIIEKLKKEIKKYII
ncbi:MAG: RNA polymerase sporulation sigma factor SigE [Clostridia bacterium]|nr:RNA polymerase sporulation sigma factor SigE [Clostridia bacterium]